MYKKDKDSPLASLVINHKKLHKITCDPNIPEHIFFRKCLAMRPYVRKKFFINKNLLKYSLGPSGITYV